MNKKSNTKLERLMDRLIQNAFFNQSHNPTSVGKMIMNLKPSDRKLIKKLKSKHLQCRLFGK